MTLLDAMTVWALLIVLTYIQLGMYPEGWTPEL